MKFDFVIGNPPYQEETDSDSTRKPPVYNLFMEEAYKVGKAVELVTPARFLFNAGYTPKNWNEKMLRDEHFKVVYYEPQSDKVDRNTEINGGSGITYRNTRKKFGAIKVFTKYEELNSILKKITKSVKTFMDEIISSPLSYQLSEKMKMENPDALDRLRTSAFSTLSTFFHIEKPNDNNEYIRMIGLYQGKRTTRYVRKDYIRDISDTLNKYTLLMPKASGAGKFGEQTGPTIIAEPGLGYTQTFIGIGRFDSAREAENVQKYVKTKFCRAMLGVLKITQDLPAPKWKYVPLQDFSPSSDINWSKPIADIDKQLYKKYKLTKKEIDFIETHVKEMA